MISDLGYRIARLCEKKIAGTQLSMDPGDKAEMNLTLSGTDQSENIGYPNGRAVLPRYNSFQMVLLNHHFPPLSYPKIDTIMNISRHIVKNNHELITNFYSTLHHFTAFYSSEWGDFFTEVNSVVQVRLPDDSSEE